MRGAIAALPDGSWTARTMIDGYSDSDDPARRDLPIVATVTVAGEAMTVDLTGTAPQMADRPINMPFEGTVDIAVWLTIRSILLDTAVHGHIPVNEGLTRPIRIVAPKGLSPSGGQWGEEGCEGLARPTSGRPPATAGVSGDG